MKLFIVFGACAAFLDTAAFAQPADLIKNSPDWVRGMVVTDGGAVYTAPDFDAKVADYLAFKQSVWATRKAVPGHGGLGLFHRVRYKNKSGFMADTDIRMTGGKDAPEKETVAEKPKAGEKPAKKSRSKAFNEEDKPKEGDPIYFKRYVGAAVAMVGFSEKFSGKKYSDNMTMYGLRMTGPGTLFDGPPLDFNIWFSMQRPKYYANFAAAPPTGFLIFGDIMAMLPLTEWGHNIINYGLGAMYTYTRYKVQVKNSTFDSQEFRMGLDVDLGYGHKFGSYAFRADVKYYYERTQYLGYLVSFQTEY